MCRSVSSPLCQRKWIAEAPGRRDGTPAARSAHCVRGSEADLTTRFRVKVPADESGVSNHTSLARERTRVPV
jgi:hypothetical protein